MKLKFTEQMKDFLAASMFQQLLGFIIYELGSSDKDSGKLYD